MKNDLNSKWDQLSVHIESLMKTHNIPGVSIGIYKSGEFLTTGFGVTSVDNPLPVTDKTLFQIGSITKTFTCTVIMRLVELGKLDLDAPLRSYYPEFKVSDEETSSKVSIYHLLAHTAGWLGDFFIGTGSGEDAMAKYASRMSELDQVSPLGSNVSYNNSGFYLLGYLIELVSGKSYEETLNELVLEPLGLIDCLLEPSQVMVNRFSVGHRVTDGIAEVAIPWALPRAAYPAGGLTSNVNDLLKYSKFHIDGGKTHNGDQILNVKTVEKMQTPQETIWADKELVGLSWFINNEDGKKIILHGGGTVGQVSTLQFIPEDEFAFAILTNSNSGGQLITSVRKWILKEYAGVEIEDPKPIDIPIEKKKECEGRYVLPRLGYTDIRVLGGKLIAQDVSLGGFPTEDTPPVPTPPPYTLEYIENDRLIVVDGPFKNVKYDIFRDKNGAVKWLRGAGRIQNREPMP